MQRNYGRGQWHDRKPVVSVHACSFGSIKLDKIVKGPRSP